jgi:hypothetical protein
MIDYSENMSLRMTFDRGNIEELSIRIIAIRVPGAWLTVLVDESV